MNGRSPTGPSRADGRRHVTRFGSAVLIGLLSLVGLPQGAGATLQLLKPSATAPATFFGRGGYSADGLGQNGTGGTIQAEVPAGSTVVQAYLYATYYGNTTPDLSQRSIDFDGTTVVLDTLANSEAGLASLSTARATVTSQVSAKVGGGGGITDFAVNSDPAFLDGVALVVIFSNPGLPEVTVALLDGGSKQAGDTATFNFSVPLDTTIPAFSAVMSLGIGFSSQGAPGHLCGGNQFSTVDINGSPLTSCAGSYDDGLGISGALITVGGVGDSIDNPTSPTTQTGTDDELYNLAPFLNNGDTALTIRTTNPSNDDNLFLSIISVTARAAVTTEVCSDGVDNDGDGLADSADPDCETRPPPRAPTSTTYSGATTAQYSDPVTLSGRLLDTSVTPNAGVAGKTLAFALGTQTASAGPTGADGNASTLLTVTQQPTVTTVATSYAGDAGYQASSDSDAFTVTKEDCTVAYTGDTKVAASPGDTTLAAQMGEPDTSLGDLGGKTVTFTLTDPSAAVTTYTAVTNASGAASTSVPLPATSYSAGVSFGGDGLYGACSSPNATVITEPAVPEPAAVVEVTGRGWFTGPRSSEGGLFSFVDSQRTRFRLHLGLDEDGVYEGEIRLTDEGNGTFDATTATGVVLLADNTVSWTGTGTWRWESGYTFEITVVDNGSSSHGLFGCIARWSDATSSDAEESDTISVKVFETSDPGNVVYTTAGAKPLRDGDISVELVATESVTEEHGTWR